MSGLDTINWAPHAKVLKYDPDTVAEIAAELGREPSGSDLRRLEENEGLVPDSVVEAAGNLLTTAGLNRITSLIIGGGGQALTNSRMAIGVGDSSTAAAVGDVALGGNSSTHSWWQGPDASNPTQSNGVITANATFASGDGNFAWNEWGWGIGTAAIVPGAVFATATTGGLLLNHKVQSLGTKSSGAVWTLQATITLS
jgi:hypothetical protein